MKAFYYLRNDDESTAKLLGQFADKKIKIFMPFACENCSMNAKAMGVSLHAVYEKSEGIRLFLENKFAFFKRIILEFKNFSKDADICVVMGFKDAAPLGASELNIKIAKELNLNLLAATMDENLALLGKNYGVKIAANLDELKSFSPSEFVTPMAFECMLETKAKSDIKTIVLPESEDDRIILAASRLAQSEAINLILLGNNQSIAARASELGVELDAIKTINPGFSQYDEELATLLYEKRKHKGMTLEKANELIKDKNYFGTLLVDAGYADGMVSGAIGSTADTIRPALQIIKTKAGVKSVSGGFFMCLDDKVHFYADCAVNPAPSAEEIASSAVLSAKAYANFGFSPRVALLSFSTANSGSGESVELVKNALEFAKNSDILVDGPMQFDAAVDEKVASKKMPQSQVAGRANVFIFPDLDAANIAYKAVQRNAKALAIGPILLGLNKPINDLSRGCSVDDIVNTCLITAICAQG